MKNKTKSLGFKLVMLLFFAVFIAMVFYLTFSYIIINDLTFNWEKLVINGTNISPILIVLFSVLVSVVLGCLFSLLLAKSMTKPLLTLKKAMLNISKGKLVKLEKPDSDDEINDLFKSYNKMIEDLRQMDNMSNEFVATVSHEFKTPLTAINGYATLLESDNLSDEERQLYIEKIKIATNKLSNLTSNILALSKIENKDLLSYEKFNIKTVAQDVILLYEYKWSAKDLQIKISEEDIEINSNKQLVISIFSNLISNAIKYTDVGEISINITQSNNCVRIEISDTGTGISPEEIEKIFDKFYQTDSSRASEGNGLGLCIVKAIVTKLQGNISVKSTIGKGTTFSVVIPNNLT